MFQRGLEEEGHSDEIDFTSVLLRALLVISVLIPRCVVTNYPVKCISFADSNNVDKLPLL